MNDAGNGSGRTTKKLLNIISTLDEEGASGVTELASSLGLPKSTIHYHLQILQESGYVLREGQKYRLGLRFLQIGERTRRRIPLYNAAKEEIDKLGEVTGELAILMVEEQGKGVILYKEPGANAVDMDASIGRHATLHDRALGKAILAHLPRERVEEIIELRGLRQTTDETITDREVLFEQLEQIRERGVAFNRSEAVKGHNGIAVPILSETEDLLGAISVAGPAIRLGEADVEEEIISHLFQAQNVIELKLRKQR